MKKIIFLILIILFNPNLSFAKEPSEIYSDNEQSLLYLTTQNKVGSGVILKEDGTFATAFHCIADADYIEAYTNDGKAIKVNGYIYIDPEYDIAILTLSKKQTYKPVKISKEQVKTGDKIYTLSNPKGVQSVFSDGMINKTSKNYIQFSAPASNGSSGGALFNKNGELIGIISAQYDPSKAQNMNFALSTQAFINHLEHKKRLNSKKLVWTDFLITRASAKQFEKYINYIHEQEDKELAYRYLKPVEGVSHIQKEDYALWGTRLLFAYFDTDFENKNFINESVKWYKSSIESGENLELSYLGFAIGTTFREYNKEDAKLAEGLKKYTKSYKIFQKANKALEKDNNKNSKNVFKALGHRVRLLYDEAYGSN